MVVKLLLLLSCVAFISVQGDDCRPSVVTNLRLSKAGILSWDPPAAETCEISHYLIVAAGPDPDDHRSFTVTQRTLDVTELGRCVRHRFEVRQISTGNTAGSAASLVAITPPPSENDLALEYLRLVPDGHDVRLQWSLAEPWTECAQRYRLVIVNEANGRASDAYTTSPTATVVGLVPCAPYTFTVRALFTIEEEGPASVVRHNAPQAEIAAPTLEGLTLGTNNIDLTLGLQRLEQNWCSVSSINIHSPTTFNTTFSVTDQTSRNRFNARLIGLQPDTLYYLRISVTNTAGNSRPLAVAVQTLPSN